MEELLWLNRGILLNAYVIAMVLLAFSRGGDPEKASALVFLAMLGLDRIYHFFVLDGASVWTISTYQTVDIGHFIIDSLALAAFMSIAVHANRIYPICIGGFQIIALFSHFSQSLLTETHPVAYAFIERAPFYVQTAAFTVGLVGCISRHRHGRTVRCWREDHRSKQINASLEHASD